MAKRPIELTEAEWTVMKSVWEHEPCTAPAIHEQLQRDTQWSYSTVRTIMDRLVGKRILTAEKAGKVTLFRSAISRRRAQRGELLYALKNAFSGALTPMVQCLIETGNLSADELDGLEELIKAKKRGSGK